MLGRTCSSHSWHQFGVFPAFLPLVSHYFRNFAFFVLVRLFSLPPCGQSSSPPPGLAVLCSGVSRVSVSSVPSIFSPQQLSPAAGPGDTEKIDNAPVLHPPSLPPTRFSLPHSPFPLLLLTFSGPLTPFFFLSPLLFPPDYLTSLPVFPTNIIL